uniref:Uncharacterized protein n=1 Tax=Nelumbo nucifera TaxID=4432 RepID=A0A822XVQ1_NELNU|nr:TPA_asm: hypothetical protein HUJ06_025884 [Nelumbo nucifera]
MVCIQEGNEGEGWKRFAGKLQNYLFIIEKGKMVRQSSAADDKEMFSMTETKTKEMRIVIQSL